MNEDFGKILKRFLEKRILEKKYIFLERRVINNTTITYRVARYNQRCIKNPKDNGKSLLKKGIREIRDSIA